MASTSMSDLGTVTSDDRNTFLAVANRADADGGLQLRVSEPDGATGNFLPTQVIASGITRGVYHRLDITAKFLDGTANDTVEYALDGVPLANLLGGITFGTFEGWRDGLQFTYALTNRLFFRSGAPPEQLWRIRRHDRPGLLLRRPVLRRREPVSAGQLAGRLCDGVRAARHSRAGPDYH